MFNYKKYKKKFFFSETIFVFFNNITDIIKKILVYTKMIKLKFKIFH